MSRAALLDRKASRLQTWVRKWRSGRSLSSVTMAGVVADTIVEFQRALDRELGKLSSRAKKAVSRVEVRKGEPWFLDELNARLKAMHGAGVAEALGAAASATKRKVDFDAAE